MDPPTKSISVPTGALGLWLVAFPFRVGLPSPDRWNDIVVGGLITTGAGYNYSRERTKAGPEFERR